MNEGVLRRTARRVPVWPILALFVPLGLAWIFLVPVPIEGSNPIWGNFHPDESDHLRVIRFMADHALAPPPYDALHWTSHHPPYYHAVCAIIYGMFRALPEEAIVRLLRLLSLGCGVATITLVYRAARRLYLPHETALLSATVAGLVPMFVAMSGAINTDAPVTLTATAALSCLLTGLRRGFDRKRTLRLMFATVAAASLKLTAISLLPVAAVAWLVADRRRHVPLLRTAAKATMLFSFFALTMGWWFVRNTVVYGDPVRMQADERLMGEKQPGYVRMREKNSSLSVARYYLHVTTFGWRTFWGAFNAQSRLLPLLAYVFLAIFQAASGAAFLRRRWRRKRLWRALALCVGLFFLASMVLFYRFNWTHLSPQGRYFFPLLLPFGIATAIGWHSLFPRRLRRLASVIIGVFLLGLNLYALTAIRAADGTIASMSIRPSPGTAAPQ